LTTFTAPTSTTPVSPAPVSPQSRTPEGGGPRPWGSRWSPGKRGTGDRTTVIVGALTVVTLAFTTWLGLWVSPPDVVQGNLVRLIYVHPATATMCYVGFGLCAVSSMAWLWPRTRSPRWDSLAGASAEVGVVFCGLCLISGSIWGRGSWGVWWTWDARLTLTALLFVVFLGYLALRRVGGDPTSRAKRSAITAILCFVVVPIDHEATTWWVTLHQGDTLLRGNPLIHGWQLATCGLSFVAFGLLFAWLVIHRYRIELLEERYETEGFVNAIAERRAEGAPAFSAEGAPAFSAEGAPALNAEGVVAGNIEGGSR
jgi:heme exporter protein C